MAAYTLNIVNYGEDSTCSCGADCKCGDSKCTCADKK